MVIVGVPAAAFNLCYILQDYYCDRIEYILDKRELKSNRNIIIYKNYKFVFYFSN